MSNGMSKFLGSFCPETENKRLKDLMYGLLYPAILGTGIVVLLTHIVEVGQVGKEDPYLAARTALGIMTLVVYCASYAALDDRLIYGLAGFLFDVGEIIVIFVCLWCLGLLEVNSKEPIETRKYVVFVLALLVDLLGLQPQWRKFVHKPAVGQKRSICKSIDYWRLRGVAIVVLGVFVLFAIDRQAPAGDYEAPAAIAAAVAVIGFLILHEFEVSPINIPPADPPARK